MNSTAPSASVRTSGTPILFYLYYPLFALSFIVYPVLGWVVTLFDRSGRTYLRLMRSWARVVFFALRVKIRVHGAEKLDPERTYIFVSNHQSQLDIPAIELAVPNLVVFVYKEELTKVPVWGWLLPTTPHIMIRRAEARDAMKSIERAAEQVRTQDLSVVIFPEGTRSSDGRLQDFKRGGFLLAARTGAPIVPVAISGSINLLPRGDLRVRSGTFDITIGEVIENHPNLTREQERALQERTRAAIAEMLGNL